MRAILQSSVFAAAALLAAPAFAQSQDKPYCLESQVGARTCIYESLERCQHMAAMRSIGGRCVINPAQSGTVGAGGMDAPRGTEPHSNIASIACRRRDGSA